MKKIISAACAGMFLFLTGCGEKKEASAPQQKILRFSWWGGTARHEATIKAIEAYMKKNPDIKIEAEYGGWDGHYQKVITQIIGGTAPDIMQLDAPWMPELSKSNTLIDLNEYKNLIDLSTFDQKFIADTGIYNDKLVCLPTGINGYLFIYNKNMETEYGIKMPEKITWNEFIEIGKKFNEAAKGEKSFWTNGSMSVRDAVLRRIVAQIGNKNMADDNYQRLFNKQELTQAFEIINNIYKNELSPNYANVVAYDEDAKNYPEFAKGNIYGSFELISQIAAAKDLVPNANWDVVPLPTLENSKDTGTWARPAQVFSVSKNSKHPEEAVKFLNYLFNDEEAIKILGTTRSLPSTGKAMDILTKTGQLDEVTAKAGKLLQNNMGIKQNIPEYEATLIKIDREMIQKIALDKITPDQAAGEIEKLYDDELARLRASKIDKK